MTAASNLDPRTKLFLIACLTTSAVVMTHWTFLTGLFVVSVLLLLIFGVSPWSVIIKTRMLLHMVAVIAIMQSIFVTGGQTLIMVGGLKLVTTSGLTMAVEFVLRMLVIVASAGIISTSNSREIIQGLVQWKMPFELAFMAAMGIRFLPVFAEEFRNAIIAIQLRGVDLKSLHFQQRLEIFTSLFQPVVAGAMIKSKAISMSIEMRGFRAYPTRTSYLVLKCNRNDYGVMIGTGLLTAIIIIWYFLIY
ncbi:MAG: energy-coupling factor transporter transmembrane component T [Syntrophomonas sp.]